MSANERLRLDALRRVKRKELSVVEAAQLAGLSVRQMRRCWKRFKAKGDAGLVHRLRGQPSNRRMAEELADRIIKRHQERYADFGPTLACEKLAEEKLTISPDTLTSLLKARGLWQRRRRHQKHRRRRERRQHFGSLVQMDGSHHDWFESRAPWCVLMVMVDDATSRTYARFYPAETTGAAFDVFARWCGKYGVPRGVYVDRHSIYRDEDHPEKPTQFGRAMGELKVALICARSPQAKGRVERKHGVFQDRLVKELRLRNISDRDQANALLDGGFLDAMNKREAVSPKHAGDLHRKPAAIVDTPLAEVLCVQEERVVGKDWCVRWNNRWLQLATTKATAELAGKRVLIKQLGTQRLLLMDRRNGGSIAFKELAARPASTQVKRSVVRFNNKVWKPGANHPWNRDRVGQAAAGTNR